MAFFPIRSANLIISLAIELLWTRLVYAIGNMEYHTVLPLDFSLLINIPESHNVSRYYNFCKMFDWFLLNPSAMVSFIYLYPCIAEINKNGNSAPKGPFLSNNHIYIDLIKTFLI